MIESDNNRLILKTQSFKAEKGSVLHSGIFNRELSSTFVAAAMSLAYLLIIFIVSQLNLIHYIISAILFIIFFPISRTYIFKKSILETVIDKYGKTISTTRLGVLGSKKIIRAIDELIDIKFNHIKFEPENPDGVAFVEKIAIQHGTVIPGFGQTEHYYTVELLFNDTKITIFSSNIKEESESVISELREFIGFN